MRKKFKKNISVSSSTSIWLLLLAASATTLYFNTRLVDPFNTPKLIILILTASWMLGHLISMKREEILYFSGNTYSFWLVCGFFFLSLTISFVFTDLSLIGLIGDSQRRDGFLTYLSFLIILIYTYFKFDAIYLLRLFKVFISLGIILGAYGLLQTTGNDFVAWLNPYNPIITTLGNPNFASAMFAMILTFSLLTLSIKSINSHLKFLALTSLTVSAVCIVRSQSRQGLVAAGLAFVFCVVVNAWVNDNKFKRIISLLSLLLVLIALLGMLQIGPLSQFLYKESVSIRGFYWRAGIRMFQAEPLTGIGLDRYGAYFKEYREFSHPLRYGFELTSSNAHNTFIQFFSTGGLFLGISYMALNILVLTKGLHLVKNTSGDVRKFSLAILSTWVAFQSQSFISIDNIGLTIWGWILGGTILSLSRQLSTLGHLENITELNVRQKNLPVKVFQPIVSAVLTIPVIFFSTFLFKFESDSYNLRAVSNGRPPNYIELIGNLNNSLAKNPISDPFYKFQAALALVDIEQSSKAESQIKDLLEEDPRNTLYLSWLALNSTTKKDFRQAIDYRLRISDHDPWNADNLLKLGLLYLEIGDASGAYEMKLRILSFADNHPIGESARNNLP